MTEAESRIARTIARARVCHMSNAKWQKLFAALHALPTPCTRIGLKLIGQGRVLSVPTPGPEFEFNDNFGECGGLSAVPFAHIEFVGISDAFAPPAELAGQLSAYGQWPVSVEDEGIIIRGYEWD